MLIKNEVFENGTGTCLDGSCFNFTMESLSRKCISTPNTVKKCIFKNMEGVATDGITIINPQLTLVQDCYFDRENCDPTSADELASAVQGADVIFDRCYFRCSGKGVLVGSGDTNLTDILSGQRVIFHECVFDNVCRRNPFAQIGQVYVLRCLIQNWGTKEYFHTKSYGARAGYMGQLIIKDTIFKQESFWTCLKRGTLLKDIFNHYLYPLFGVPGFARAAYADYHGQIACYNCYKNRWWLYIQNHRKNYMPKEDALNLEEQLYNTVVKPYKK